jgi:hypothetical protein
MNEFEFRLKTCACRGLFLTGKQLTFNLRAICGQVRLKNEQFGVSIAQLSFPRLLCSDAFCSVRSPDDKADHSSLTHPEFLMSRFF